MQLGFCSKLETTYQTANLQTAIRPCLQVFVVARNVQAKKVIYSAKKVSRPLVTQSKSTTSNVV